MNRDHVAVMAIAIAMESLATNELAVTLMYAAVVWLVLWTAVAAWGLP